MSALRVWLVGSGVVGRWLARALDTQAGRLAIRYGRAVTVVGIANARDGFGYDAGGLDLASVLGRPITGEQGTRVWPSAIEGLRATGADVLVQVTAGLPADGEPAFPPSAKRCSARSRWSRPTSGRSPCMGPSWPAACHMRPRWMRHSAGLAEPDPAALSMTPSWSSLTRMPRAA